MALGRTTLTISSRVNTLPDHDVQYITVPGLRERFCITEITIDGSTFRRYAILDEQLTTVLLTSTTRADLIMKLHEKVRDMDDLEVRVWIRRDE